MLSLKKAAFIVLNLPQMLFRISSPVLSLWDVEGKQSLRSILQVVIRDTYHFKRNLQHLFRLWLQMTKLTIIYTYSIKRKVVIKKNLWSLFNANHICCASPPTWASGRKSPCSQQQGKGTFVPFEISASASMLSFHPNPGHIFHPKQDKLSNINTYQE